MKASLGVTEEWFAKTIMDPRSLAEATSEDEAAEFVTPGPRQSRLERLGVYHSGYRSRLVECLADDYPGLRYAFGEERFEALCHTYIAAHPSRSPNLNAFGRHVPSFVSACGMPNAAFLGELATLEWTVVEAIHAAPAPSIDLAALKDIPPDRWADARFVPGGVRLLGFEYPVNGFFQAFRDDRAPRIPDAEATTTAVYRQGWSVWRMDLAPSMHAVLEALFAGDTLGQALDRAASQGGSEEDVIVAFRTWVAGGFFARVDLTAPASATTGRAGY